MITVTTTDHDTGDVETAELAADSYVLVCGERLQLINEQFHRNGTVVITMKKVDQ